MNRLLASALGFVNVLLAASIVAFCIFFARDMYGPTYTAIGAGVGFLVATLSCGLLALFIDIRNTLIELLEETRRTGAVSQKNYNEPRI